MKKQQQKAAMSDDDEELKLPQHIRDSKNKVRIGTHAPSNSATPSFHGTFSSVGYDNSFNLDKWKKQFKIKIISRTSEELVFDMIGVDAPIANAFRRILIAEVPTMAIEKVVIENNTSIMQDEVLAHRLGLVPIKADPRMFVFRKGNYFYALTLLDYAQRNATIIQNDGSGGDDWHPKASYPLYENASLCFKLDVTCKKVATKDGEEVLHSKVYSSDLKWVPIGKQAEAVASAPIKPVYDDILIAKMRPGQTITAELYCEKGVGKTHAKWSPVSTATYRLLPEITFLQPVKGEEAKQLKKKCPMNVFDIEDVADEMVANVARPRNCTMCRECIREEGWEKKIKLERVKDHFIFSIESTGALKPEEIFVEAIKVLYEKCDSVLAALNNPASQQTKQDSMEADDTVAEETQPDSTADDNEDMVVEDENDETEAAE